MSQKLTKSERIKAKRLKRNKKFERIQKEQHRLDEQKFIIKRILLNRGMWAASAMSFLFAVMAVTMLVLGIWTIGVPLLFIALVQFVVESRIYYQLNHGFANLITITKYKKSWIFFLLTGNILGAIYVGLLVR